MKSLSQLLNEQLIEDMKREISNGKFPKVSFEQAMQFILTNGVLPASDLPVTSFLRLEDWLHTRRDGNRIEYTTTELKNKTGEILQRVMEGQTVKLLKHGRPIAEIRRILR